MSRKRMVLAGVGGLVLVVFLLQAVLSRGPSGGASESANQSREAASGSLAQRMGAPAAPAASAPAAAPPAAPGLATDAARDGSAPASAIGGQGAPAQALPSLDRMIIRNVSMTLVVADVMDAYRQIELLMMEQGGLVAGSQLRQEGDRTLATVTLRVPADGRGYQAT